MVPRRDLGPRVCCSHTFVPLGARWYLGTCKKYPDNPIFRDLNIVLPWDSDSANKDRELLVYPSGSLTCIATCAPYAHMHTKHITMCIIIIQRASWQMHHAICITSSKYGYLIFVLHHHKHTKGASPNCMQQTCIISGHCIIYIIALKHHASFSKQVPTIK